MKMHFRFFFIGVLIFTILSIVIGCKNDVFYDKAYEFKDGVWKKQDTVFFNVDVENIDKKHDFILTLRTRRNYPYSNLWVYILITSPDGSTSKVAQEIPLANPDGSWIGKKTGTLIESKLRFDAKPFPLSGKYIFSIVNATQNEEIPSVEDISLRIE